MKNKRLIKNEIMNILLDIYYGSETIYWDSLQEKALFLYKHKNLGPLNTEKVAIQLYKLYDLFLTKSKKIPSLFYDEYNGSKKLSDFVGLGKIPSFGDIKNTYKEVLENINPNYLEFYLKKKMIILVSYLRDDASVEVKMKFRNKFRYSVEYYVHNWYLDDTKEMYRLYKEISSFLQEQARTNYTLKKIIK